MRSPPKRERKQRKTITATITMRYPVTILFLLGATSVAKRVIRKAVSAVVNKMKKESQ